MLLVKFKEFMDLLKKERRTKRPTLHYVETTDYFKLLFKNYEYWKYYTVIDKSVIVSFGAENDISSEDSINDFRLEYLYHAVPIEEEDIKIHKEESEESKKDDDEELEEETLNKTATKTIVDPYEDTELEKELIKQISEQTKKVVEALERENIN